MSPFLIKAYAISTAISLFAMLLFSPPVLDYLFKYIGWSGYTLFAIFLMVWVVTFLCIGIFFNEDNPPKVY